MTAPLSPEERDRLADALPDALQPVGALLKWSPLMYRNRNTATERLSGYGEQILDALAPVIAQIAEERTGDEYHTLDELYEYRMLYNALAVSEWADSDRFPVVKSWNHSDGKPCFGGGWFIVVATLPAGQVSNHYKAEHWDLFQCPEVDLPPEYDGHTPRDAADRMRAAVTPVRIHWEPPPPVPEACEERACDGQGMSHQGTSWKSGYREDQYAPCGRPCEREAAQ